MDIKELLIDERCKVIMVLEALKLVEKLNHPLVYGGLEYDLPHYMQQAKTEIEKLLISEEV